MASSYAKGRFGAACWLACAQFFLAEAVTSLGWHGQYSYRNNFISDLGALGCRAGCSPWHALMNASFGLQGLLIAAGALLLPGRLFREGFGVAARLLLLLAALGVIAVACAPEDFNMNFHIAGARLYFLTGSLGMLCFAFAQRRRPPRLHPAATFFASAVALFGDLLMIFGNSQSATLLGAGTIERLAAYPFPLWLTWTGLTLLRSPRLISPSDL